MLTAGERSHGRIPVGATLHKSGFEPVGAEERSYGNAAYCNALLVTDNRCSVGLINIVCL